MGIRKIRSISKALVFAAPAALVMSAQAFANCSLGSALTSSSLYQVQCNKIDIQSDATAFCLSNHLSGPASPDTSCGGSMMAMLHGVLRTGSNGNVCGGYSYWTCSGSQPSGTASDSNPPAKQVDTGASNPLVVAKEPPKEQDVPPPSISGQNSADKTAATSPTSNAGLHDAITNGTSAAPQLNSVTNPTVSANGNVSETTTQGMSSPGNIQSGTISTTETSNANGSTSATVDQSGASVIQNPDGTAKVIGTGDPSLDSSLTNSLNNGHSVDLGGVTYNKQGHTITGTNDYTDHQVTSTQISDGTRSSINTPGGSTLGGSAQTASSGNNTSQSGRSGTQTASNPMASKGSAKTQGVDADTDNCSNSGYFSGDLQGKCKGTGRLIETSQITTIAGQMGGSMTLGTMGAAQQQRLMMNGGSQADAMKAAASLQMKAAGLQTAVGATQLMMGYMEQRASKQHGSASGDLTSKIVNSKSVNCAVGTYDPNSGMCCVNFINGQCVPAQGNARYGSTNDLAKNALASTAGNNIQGMSTQDLANEQMQNYGRAAVKEQQYWKSQASSASFKDYLQGAKTTASGVMAMMAAKQQEALANKLANLQTGAALPGGADNFNNTAQVPRAPTIITDNGNNNPNTSPVPGPSNAGLPGDPLGGGGGAPAGNGLANGGPAANPFVAGNSGTSSGNPGGGGLGGNTGTSASPPGSADDPQAKYASNGGGNGAAYQGGGSVMGGGGGGGGKGGGNGDNSISLKDAFAQLLGQNGEAAKKDDPGVDIMNYRKLASDSPYAPLPQGEDFFKYIHQAYEGLQKKGRIGL